MTSIPNDLINEICSRLPSKSIARFRCLSKLWCSMFHRPYFTELFLTRSSARPRLLFAIEGNDAWSFFSLPQPHNPYVNSSSLVVAADFHMTLPSGLGSLWDTSYAAGLISISQNKYSKEEDVTTSMICNPSTGQYSILPQLIKHVYCRPFLGFDPIDKQFKVLLIKADTTFDDVGPTILTLGTGKMRWRKIQCPLAHKPWSYNVICINGVLYYLADTFHVQAVIVCFDVRSEEFKFIDASLFCFLGIKYINYKGNLGLFKWDCDAAELRLSMWVLEDVEKEEWYKYDWTLRDDVIVDHLNASAVSFVGMTATGEIVLSTYSISRPFYVYYFSPNRKTPQRVEIQGFGEYNLNDVEFFVDHVEDLNLNDAKYLKSSCKRKG